MEVGGALEILEQCAACFDSETTDVSLKDSEARLRIVDATREEFWAVISSSGYWFELSVPGSYAIITLDEDVSDEEARQILERYVGIAQAYFRNRPLPTPVGRWGRSVLTVETESGPVVLRKSLVNDLRDCLRWRSA